MDFLFGNQNQKELNEYEKIIEEIKKYGYDGYQRKDRIDASDGVSLYRDAITSHTDLKKETKKLKEYVNGKEENLDEVLPKAFAIICEAFKRSSGGKINPYPVQLMGAIALHRGNIAEMKTGEGKTITAVIAAYLNALTGKGVQITTSNDYLAMEGYREMGPVLELSGISVGVVTDGRNKESEIELQKRKEAYSCDVTYASSDTLAFDYLFDNIAKTQRRMVNRNEQTGFIIIDEADQILVNNAINPFRISDNRDKQMIEQNKTYIKKADEFVYSLYCKAHCLKLDTEEQMEIHLGGNREVSKKNQCRYSVIYSRSKGAELTEKGWLQAFKYFNGEEIKKIANRNKDLIIASSDYEEGAKKDYTLDRFGNISLTLRGIERTVRNIEEMQQLNNHFYDSCSSTGFIHDLNNALTAYFVLSNGVDYSLIDFQDRDEKVKKKVALVSDGRIHDGTVYGNGLQQAVELKEKHLNPNEEIYNTEESQEVASITQKAFYARYPKVSGMTGTSAKEIFETIYGMNTVEIPKDSEYHVTKSFSEKVESGRVNQPEQLFATKEEKLDAVINSILESNQKGQPVLIGTASVEESRMLYNALLKRGVQCEVLNAENANQESEIIRMAGVPCAITISTQMAGRGTDIKLGGTLEGTIQELKEDKYYMFDMLMAERAKKMVHNLPLEKRKNIGDEALAQQALAYLKDHPEEFIQKEAREILEKRKERAIQAGGLKVIGFGHYATKRNDDQLRGRAARQADPGVTEFYSCIDDLRVNLNVLQEDIDKLVVKEGQPLSGDRVSEIIEHAQRNNEWTFSNALDASQESDQTLARLRKVVYEQRKRVVFGSQENFQEHMEYMIDTTSVNLIDKHLASSDYQVSPKKKIAKSKLDLTSYIDDVITTFGITDIEEKINNGELETLGDLEVYVSRQAKDNYKALRAKNGKTVQDLEDRKGILATIDNAWQSFNDSLEFIRFENHLNNLVQNKDFKEIYAMKKGFNKAMVDAKIELLGNMFGKKIEKNDMLEDSSLEEDRTLNNYSVYDLKPRKTLITVLSDKVKLIKNKFRSWNCVIEDEETELSQGTSKK